MCHPFRSDNVSRVDQLVLSLEAARKTSRKSRTGQSCKDAKLSQLPAAFTCFGQQVSVSVQPSLLARAHLYQQRAQMQPPAQQHTMLQSPRHKRRHQQKARAKKAASLPSAQHQQQLQSLQTTFCPAVSADGDLGSQGRVTLTRALDPASDLGGQQGRAGLGHSVPEPMQEAS